MNPHDKFFHWVMGDNILRKDRPEYLINLEYGLSIKFNLDDAYMATYDQFINGIADIQFLNGERPPQSKINELTIEAWNFLSFVEIEEDNLAQQRGI